MYKYDSEALQKVRPEVHSNGPMYIYGVSTLNSQRELQTLTSYSK